MPKEGFCLPSEIDLWTMGDHVFQNHGVISVSDPACLTFDQAYDFRPVVEAVEITGVPEVADGKSATTDTIKAPENAPYTVFHSYWIDCYTGEPVEGSFHAGGKYQLFVEIGMVENYRFSYNTTTVTLNGTEPDWDDMDIGTNNISIRPIYSLEKPVDAITITGVTAPEAGKAPTTEGIQIPENAGYEITATWCRISSGNYGTPMEEGEVFEDGNRYRLWLEISAKQGYCFDRNIPITVDGAAPEYDVVYPEHGQAQVRLEYQLGTTDLTVIEEIAITDTTVVADGKSVTTEGIKLPEGAKYEIADAMWFDPEYNLLSEGDTFRDGCVYYLDLYLIPSEGYAFSEDASITVNGEAYEGGYAAEDHAYIGLEYSLADPIDEIVITGLPTAVAGETAGVESLKVPENANYELYAEWLDDYGNPITGVFEDGNIYELFLIVKPKEGYAFTDDTVITVDGKEPASNNVYSSRASCELYYYHALGLKEISTVDLEIELPTLGHRPIMGDYLGDPYYFINKKAGYEGWIYWQVSDTADGNTEDIYSTFRDGKYYFIDVTIEPLDGYAFADELTLTINGIPYTVDEEDAYYDPGYAGFYVDLGLLCDHTYGDWANADADTHAKTCSKCGDIISENHTAGTTVEHDGTNHWNPCTVCGGKVNVTAHTAGQWQSDDKQHWADCSCGEKVNAAEHVYDNVYDAECNTCGYTRKIEDVSPPTGDAAPAAVLMALCSMAAIACLTKRKEEE